MRATCNRRGRVWFGLFVVLSFTCACALGPRASVQTDTPVPPQPTLVEPSATVIDSTATPEISPDPSPEAPVDEELPDGSASISKMLSYVPAKFADAHLPVWFGPSVYVFDFVRMKADLDVPPLTGASARKDKLKLLTGINTQGLPYLPNEFDCTLATAFETWGWDIADVDQILYMPELEFSIVSGRFDLSKIQPILEEKATATQSSGLFELYILEDEGYRFAIRPDLLVISSDLWEQDQFELLLNGIRSMNSGLDAHPAVAPLIPGIQGAWGVILAPSPDVVGLWERIREDINDLSPDQREAFGDFLSFQKEPEKPAWDFLAISYRYEDKQYPLTFQYQYPAPEEASQDVETLQSLLTETPSLIRSGATLADFITLDATETEDNLLVARAHTQSERFLGDTISSHQEFVFLPLRYH